MVSLHAQSNWHEERHLVINRFFATGLKTHYHELIAIERQERYKVKKKPELVCLQIGIIIISLLQKLSIEALNVEDDENWLFGCEAKSRGDNESSYW